MSGILELWRFLGASWLDWQDDLYIDNMNICAMAEIA